MKILIAYATTEGQTRKIARFCSDQLIDHGHSVELMNVADCDDLDLNRFDGVVLAGSVHMVKLQKDLSTFASENAAMLAGRKSMLLVVSLSAAGDDADDLAGLDRLATEFVTNTGWTPNQIEQIAGAFKFEEYDFFRAWVMRRIARDKGQSVDPNANTEYTDWDALASSLHEWAR